MVNVNDVLYFDNDDTFDRYTAVFPLSDGVWPYFAMSTDPFHPCGFGQHGELTQLPGEHLGKRIMFTELPVNCQNAIRIELREEAA